MSNVESYRDRMMTRSDSGRGCEDIRIDRGQVREKLRHVRFIGGGNGGGKSTVARRLATCNDLQLYDAEQFSQYVPRTTPTAAPLLHAFLAMNMDERWLSRSPQIMFDTFHGFRGELFNLIIEDLLVLPETPPILAEGFTLLPGQIAPLLQRISQAVWLIPTPEFSRAAFDNRGSTWDIPSKTSDPKLALDNLFARNELFTDEVLLQATALNLPVVHVDVGVTIHELVRRVAGMLDLPMAGDD